MDRKPLKKIAIFTGNRAEYGLLIPVIQAIKEHPNLEGKLIVSGAHLDNTFGRTIDLIHKDGFDIAAEARIDLDADDLISTAKAIGKGILVMVNVLSSMRPDILVVYADRFEGFASVIAASQMGIPVAHIEGGDVTEGGALDDSIRHAMTKLSHIHFTTNDAASNRIKAMGEEEWRVFNTGLPSIDRIVNGAFASSDKIVEKFRLDLDRPIILFTQHSVSTEYENAGFQIDISLEAIANIVKTNEAQVVITSPNNDAGGRRIINRLEIFKKYSNKSIQVHQTLGSYYYHGILSLAKHPGRRIICAGNSSSGIKETPIFGCPTINIGTRQQGRLRAENVIDVGYNSEEIYTKMVFAIENDEFRKKCSAVKNPYGNGNSGRTIAAILDKLIIDKKLIQKRMTI